MDERTFDQKTALDWIAAIERPGQTVRDTDIYPMLNEWIGRASPKTILDIGCGHGRLLRENRFGGPKILWNRTVPFSAESREGALLL